MLHPAWWHSATFWTLKPLFIRTLLFALSPQSLSIFDRYFLIQTAERSHWASFYVWPELTRRQTPQHPPPHLFYFSTYFLGFTSQTCMCSGFQSQESGDRGLKAINNQMLSEPRWRKRMQLYEQDLGSRQTAVCSRSLWGPAWKWESGGVRGRPCRRFIFLCHFIPGSRSRLRKPPLFFPFLLNYYMLS